jgi:fucose 4-O-acetylase-like acetyltransferase
VTVTGQPRRTARRVTLFTVLIGLAALAVLLQGLWAGIFLEHDGARDTAASWIDTHARGAEASIALTAIAAVVAFVQLRARRELWLGSAVLTLLLLVETYLGGLIRDEGQDVLTAVHVPLAMAIMGLAVWLLLRASLRPREG